MQLSTTVNLQERIAQAHQWKVWLLIGLTTVAILTVLLAISQGPVKIPVAQIPKLLFTRELSGQEAIYQRLLIQIRIPRVLLACVAGAVFALAGTTLQALFRNPLAEPGLIGVSAGASLGAVSAIVLLGGGFWFIAPMAFVGSLVATILAYLIGKRYGGVAGLLLAGIAINAIAFSTIGFLSYVADDTQIRDFSFWSMGSLATATWPLLAGIIPWSLIGSLFLWFQWRQMNALLLGEQSAYHLGFDMKRLRRRLVLGVTLIIAPLVAVTGGIGFIGLIVPHIVRMVLGSNHRYVIPAAMASGALLLLWADYFARTIITPAELPVGLLTSMIGGPFFLWLLMRTRNH